MDLSTYEYELRHIKRRRIEIRSTQAALDMEDLNLDDRQKALEQVLRSRAQPLTSSLSFNSDPFLSDQRQPSPRNAYKLPVAAPSSVNQSEVPSTSAKIKSEPKEQPKRKSNVAVEDIQELNARNEDDDCVMLSDGTKFSENRGVNISKEATTTSHMPRNAPSPEIRTKNGSVQQKRSKIVVLKVRYPFRDGQLHSSNTLSWKRPAPSRSPARPRYQRSSESSFSDSSCSLSRQVQAAPSSIRRPSPNNTNFTQTTRVHDSAVDATYPCECRRRNCNICRGTPAVIAEGRILSSQSRYSASSSTTTRSIGQRPTSRPTSYRIPDYHEMKDTERQQLEVRFLHRITSHLSHILEPNSSHDDNASPSLNLRSSIWVKRLRSRPTTSKDLSDAIQSLLKRRAIARENADGIWDGRIVVTACKDLEDFAKSAEEIGQRLTARHPLDCCSDPDEVKLELDDDEENGDCNDSCWGGGFQTWIRTQMRRGKDCIDACDSALNVEERRRLVDEWDIA